MASSGGFPRFPNAFKTMGAAVKGKEKGPAVGVTQGGSSRKYGGAKVAATDANRKK